MKYTKRFLPNLWGKGGLKRLCSVVLMICLLAANCSNIAYAAEEGETTNSTKKLLNGSFEEGQTWTGSYQQPNQNDVPAWRTTAFQNKMELFRRNTGIYIRPNVVLEPTDGSYAAELNADEESTLYQNVSTMPFSIYEWGLDHGARNGRDIMALVIGPKQSVDPSKPNKQGRDQFMQMVDWLNIDNESVAPGAAPQRYTVYSKKFAAGGSFEDNAGNNAFSLTPSTIYTERWEIWIMSSSNQSIDENNKLIWNSYGSNAGANAEGGSESNDIDMNKYYLYTVPADQTETVFGFVSVGYLESTAAADKAKTYGNFLDNIHFQIYHPLSGSTTKHGSAIGVSSDGSTEGEGEIIGHEITVDNALQTYVTDGLPLKVQAIIRAEDKADCEFSGFYYTKQNEDGTPTTVFIPKIDSKNVIEDTEGLTEEEKAGKWTKSTNENGDTVYTYKIDAITSATDLHFVFFKSPMITYDPNGGKPYIVGEQLNKDEDANVYSFKPIHNEGEGDQYRFCPPYVSHAAEGQNDGWKFMGWKVTGDFVDIPEGADISTVNADKLGDLIIPAVHTVACDYSFDNASSLNTAQYFKFLDGEVQLTENIQYSSDNVTINSVLWENQGEELLYANIQKGMTMVAQWRWLQAFIPQSSNDIQLGFDDSDRGGHVEIAVEETDENYNGSYTENGGKSYHAATNEWVTVTAIPYTGYEFVGWYTENDAGEMVLITTNPTYKYLETKESVKTYYARFYGRIRQEYIRQVWNGSAWEDVFNDAIGVLDRYEYVDAPEKPISSTATEGKNYMFVGWYDAQGNAVGEDMLANGGKTLSYITMEDATYYARFVSLPTLAEDVAVIDFGLPVDIHVLANDTLSASGTITLAGVCPDIPTDMKQTETMLDGFANSCDGTYGSAKVNEDGTITYTKSGMMMDQPETFAYAIRYQRDGNARYCYSTVTVVPATTIYYEDSFIALEGSWETAGQSQTAHQSEDRPGDFEFPDCDADNVYGYDGAYDTCTTYSLGSAVKTTVSSNTYAQSGSWPTAQFSFSGTGFDLISLTSNQTGFITCRVYEGTATDKVYKSWVVDTYYGYTRTTDEENPWVKYTWTYYADKDHWSVVKEAVPEKGDDETAELPTNPQDGAVYVQYKENYIWTPATGADNSLYQIPVIKSPELPYGTYTVVITPTYIPFFDHTGTGSYDFYLDAVRVYNPAQNMDYYYVLDGEGWPQHIELRKQLLSKDASDNAEAYVNGISFIDGVDNGGVSDYESYGPNNEIYLNSRQAVAFSIQNNGSSIASVQVGIKTFDQTGTLTASCVDAEGNTLASGELGIGTHTDMYYSLTNLNGKSCLQWQDDGAVSQAIVLTNTGDTPITLTTLKITYQSRPSTEAELCMNLELMQAASESVTQKLASLQAKCYHRFTYAVTAAPTETEEGTLTGTCTDCGATEPLAMPVLTDARYTVEITSEPTCTSAGTKTYTDSAYAVSFTTGIPALGHDLVTDAAVAATCTQSGLTEGFHCARCAYRVEQTVTEALGHSFDDGVCTLCGEALPSEEQPTPCASADYTDVPDESDWAHEGIDFVIERGLMNGVDANIFAPEETMDRAMLVTVLWRLEGKPAAAEKASFRDVPDGTWYTEAVAWAQSEGIVNGIGEDLFDPTGEITREQMATILYRYALGKQLPEKRGDLPRFDDRDAVSAWAEEAISWAEASGILKGSAEGDRLLLQPTALLTRAQAAAMLMRYCNIMEEAK